jgi:hypothetical protein
MSGKFMKQNINLQSGTSGKPPRRRLLALLRGRSAQIPSDCINHRRTWLAAMPGKCHKLLAGLAALYPGNCDPCLSSAP